MRTPMNASRRPLIASLLIATTSLLAGCSGAPDESANRTSVEALTAEEPAGDAPPPPPPDVELRVKQLEAELKAVVLLLEAKRKQEGGNLPGALPVAREVSLDVAR